jgi:cytochrome c oxidase assembly protein subunit 15
MLSWGLVGGVIGQIVLGGIVVLTDLHPVANQGHFILSMVLVANALTLHHRAKNGSEVRRSSSLGGLQKMIRLTVVMGSVALFTGTIVTGSGPHAGDEKARRFDLAITTVARIHGISVIVAVALLVLAAWKIRQQRAQHLVGPLEMVLVVAVLQATVGYVQYFNDIPALLVGIHVFGATMFFLSLVNLWLISNQIADDSFETTERSSVIVS